MPSDVVSRREFLSGAGCVLASCAVSLPAELLALPFTDVVGESRGSERSYPVPAADGVSVDRGAVLILVRWQGHAFALSIICPHEHAAVKWVEGGQRFQCTKHDSKYKPDGTYTSGRSTRNMDRLGIRREGMTLLVDPDHVIRADQDPAGWAAALVAL